MTRAEEVHLIELATAGDRVAAAAFIKCHQQSLYAYILRLSGRPEIAEDIVQEAFVRALTHLDRFDTRFRFSTWIFTIAKRLYVNASQRHKPTYNSDIVGAARSGTGSPVTPAADDEQAGSLRDALQEALLGLPEDQREVVVLFHQLDWPISTIAQHMDMPEGTVKSHLHRGRRRLRELLEAAEDRASVIEEALR
jgi:RNA polymerase sigma-70 factor (ECF subfamily)